MHDLVGILLPKLVLESILELSVLLAHRVCQVFQLCLGAEHLGWWVLPGLVSSEIGCVLVVPQIHVEVNLVLVQCQVGDQVIVVACVAYEVQVTVGWGIDRLTTLSASNHSLEF